MFTVRLLVKHDTNLEDGKKKKSSRKSFAGVSSSATNVKNPKLLIAVPNTHRRKKTLNVYAGQIQGYRNPNPFS